MPGRPAGSMVIPCPHCGNKVVVVPGTKKECKHCNKTFRVTKKYLKELGK